MKLKSIWREAPVVLFAVTFSVIAQADENAANKAPDSYEFKVLLKNELFLDRQRDARIDAFLARLERYAESQGAKVKWKNPGRGKSFSARCVSCASCWA